MKTILRVILNYEVMVIRNKVQVIKALGSKH